MDYIIMTTLNAEQFAEQAINTFDRMAFNKQYNNGIDMEGMQFGRDFAVSCAEKAFSNISIMNPDSILEPSKQLLVALANVNDSEYTLGLDTYKQLIIHDFSRFNSLGQFELINVKMTVFEKIWEAFSTVTGSQEHKQSFIDQLMIDSGLKSNNNNKNGIGKLSI